MKPVLVLLALLSIVSPITGKVFSQSVFKDADCAGEPYMYVEYPLDTCISYEYRNFLGTAYDRSLKIKTNTAGTVVSTYTYDTIDCTGTEDHDTIQSLPSDMALLNCTSGIIREITTVPPVNPKKEEGWMVTQLFFGGGCSGTPMVTSALTTDDCISTSSQTSQQIKSSAESDGTIQAQVYTSGDCSGTSTTDDVANTNCESGTLTVGGELITTSTKSFFGVSELSSSSNLAHGPFLLGLLLYYFLMS